MTEPGEFAARIDHGVQIGVGCLPTYRPVVVQVPTSARTTLDKHGLNDEAIGGVPIHGVVCLNVPGDRVCLISDDDIGRAILRVLLAMELRQSGQLMTAGVRVDLDRRDVRRHCRRWYEQEYQHTNDHACGKTGHRRSQPGRMPTPGLQTGRGERTEAILQDPRPPSSHTDLEPPCSHSA